MCLLDNISATFCWAFTFWHLRCVRIEGDYLENIWMQYGTKMKSNFAVFVLIFLSPNFAALADEPLTEVSVKGVLVRSPGAYSEKIPYVELTQKNAKGAETYKASWKLVVPGGDAVIEALSKCMDKEVTIHGQLFVHPNAKQKDGSKSTEYALHVSKLTLIKERDTILSNPNNGRWVVFTWNNGLSVIDKEAGKTHKVYDAVESDDLSQINWEASASISGDGKYLYARQGLEDSFYSLPDMKAISFKPKADNTELITLGYRGFSPDGKFVVMDGYRRAKIPDTIVVFEAASGKEVSRVEFDQGRFNRQYHFAKRNKALVIFEDQQITVLHMDTGASFTSPIE